MPSSGEASQSVSPAITASAVTINKARAQRGGDCSTRRASLISRGPVATHVIYPVLMKRIHYPTLALLTLALSACPLLLGPKDDDGKPDDEAGATGSRPAVEGTGAETDSSGTGSGSETDSGATGSEAAMACEDDLKKVKAELEACESSK